MRKSFDKILESGIFVSIILGLAYFFTYFYQKGLLDYYELPAEYIDLSLENVVKIFVYILMFLLSIYSIIRIIFINFPEKKSFKTKQILFFFFVYLALVAISLILLKTPCKQIIAYSVCFSLYIMYCFIAPFVFVKDEKNYIKKWFKYSVKSKNFFLKEIERQKESMFYPYERIIVLLGSLLMAIILLGGSFWLSGKENAQYAKEHYVAKDYSDMVVVYQTKEVYILKEETNGVLKDEFQVVSSDDIGTLKKEKTGLLKLETE